MKKGNIHKIKKKIGLGLSLAFHLGLLSSVHAAEVIEVEDTDSGAYSSIYGLLEQGSYADGTDFEITVNQAYGSGTGIANGIPNQNRTWSDVVTGNNEIRVTSTSEAIGISSILDRGDADTIRFLRTGDNTITATGVGRAIGIESWSGRAGGTSQVITGDNMITATAIGIDGSVESSAHGLSIAHRLGFNSGDMSNITTGDNEMILTATGGHVERSASEEAEAKVTTRASGIKSDGTGEITTGDNKITATSTGGHAKHLGSRAARAITEATGIGSNVIADVDNGQVLITTGDNVIRVNATGGKAESNTGSAYTTASAYGIHMKSYVESYNQENKTQTGKNDIRAIAIGGEGISGSGGSATATAIGMYTNGRGTGITATGAQSIYTEAIPGTINGATGAAYAYALLSNAGPIVLDNQGEPVQLTGDIGTSTTSIGDPFGSITVSLDHEESYWRPRFQDQIINSGYNKAPNGTFGEGSFTIENGGTLDVAWYANKDGYSFRNTSLELKGSQININDGATFIINSDIVNNEADTITANTTATGTQYVRVVYDPSMYQNGIYQTGTVNGIALVLDFAGANGQGITSTVDTALDVIEITPQMEGGYLKAVTVVGPTDPTSPEGTPEALKTVSDFYQHQMNILKLEGNNSFMRRMGDVRLEDPEKHKGAWAHTFGGKLKSDGAYGRKSSQKYYGVEAGFDYTKEVRNGRLFYGPLISYRKADSNYSRGSGDIESIALGGYVSWVSDKGHYADVVLKAVHLDTDYHLYSNRDDGGTSERISADFGNWSYLLSGEYGYRHNLSSRIFIEPQAMMTVGRLSGKGYTASNGVHFDQEGINLAVGRLSVLYGVNVGKEKNSNVYVKGSLIHDFSSTGGVTASYQGKSRLVDAAGDTGTSFEVNVGANLQLSKKNQLYFELTKSFGGDVETNWQVNAGWQIRW